MAINTIKTRIQSKYDTLANWITSAQTTPPFIPLRGEICIVEIPGSATQADTQTTNQAQMTPPAIAIKVGDGTHTFIKLPWIQGIAGDVYAWAKAATKPTYTGNEITATRKDSTDLTNENKWTQPSIQDWLQALTNDINGLSGGAGSISTQIANALADLDVDNVDTENGGTSTLSHHILGFAPNKTLATLTEQDGYIAATFQDIAITKNQITDAGTAISSNTATTAITDNDSSTDLPTKAQVATYVASKTAGLSGAMHYRGGVAADPTETTPTGTYASGDVVTFGNKEYVYDGTNWRELGNEGSYALSSITISGGDGLTGGGDISANRTITHAVPNGASASTKGTSGGRTYIQTITTDKFGHITGVGTATETVTNTTYTLTQDSNDGHVLTFTSSATGAQPTTITIPDNNTTYTFAEGTTDGAFSVTPSGGTAQTVSIHGLGTAAYENVEDISIYDLQEGSNTVTNPSGTKCLIFDCGTASTLVDNYTA